MLDTLRRIVQEVSNAPHLEGALTIIVQRIKHAMHADICSTYLKDKATQQYVLMATDGLNPKAIGALRLDEGQDLVSMVGEREEPVNLEDALCHPLYSDIPGAHNVPYHSFLGVPIIHHRTVMGVLVVRHRRKRWFGQDEETFLVTMASQLAGAIAHAQINGDIDNLLTRNERVGYALTGLPGAPGVGIGTAMIVYQEADLDAVPDRKINDTEVEVEIFKKAVMRTQQQIKDMSRRLATTVAKEDRALFDAYIMMLEGDSITGKTIERIRAGSWASAALRDTIAEHVHVFEDMNDTYLRDRASDVRDLGRRILMSLQSGERKAPPYPERTILVGEEITATMLAEVPRERLVGVVSIRGSSLSHVAILAHALGVPAVVGVEDLPVTRIDACELVVDGYRGKMYVSPSPEIKKEYARLANEEGELAAGLEALRDVLAETRDGHRVPLYANTGLVSDLVPSLTSGAEGIGLYRTEFPFMVRDRFPSEEEQRQIYRQILKAFHPRPVVLRTLDIGGDKSLSYFPICEDNPFLGWRGIRITLDHPEIFIVQLRAMLKASAGFSNLHILLPMISSVSELDEALTIIKRVVAECNAEGGAVMMPKVGMMIEVPAMVYLMEFLAARVDFFSIGTNDLTQYLLAVDRNNAQVASLYDALHPAVISAIKQIVIGAYKHGKPVSVCGEMAGDPAAAIVLLGLGVDSLSMSNSSILKVKWAIRNFSVQHAQNIANDVLAMENATSVRHYLDGILEEKGLGGLLRAGK